MATNDAPLLTWGDGELQRGGRPHRMLAGSIHYFRVHPELWRDRLERLRALGLNTIDTYVAWNFHERVEGERDFSGWRDVEAFISLCGEIGFDVVVRPGPYICAEWSNGGLPSWLTARTEAPRSIDAVFLGAVEDWFSDLIPRLAKLQASQGGPIVAVQVENEYGSYGSDHAYTARIRDVLLEQGITELLTTADGTDVDMQLNGAVKRTMPTFTLGSEVARAVETSKHLPAGVPIVVSEFWNGWFDHWGEPHHTRSPESIKTSLDEMLAVGASVSLYMAHGGTNFGLWAGANYGRPTEAVIDGNVVEFEASDPVIQPTVTSYDYDAPVGEDGTLGASFAVFREAFAPFHAGALPEPPAPPTFLAPQTVALTKGGCLLTSARATPSVATTPLPQSFEALGLDDGIVLYSSTDRIEPGMTLRIDDIRDRAHVLVDGVRIATLERHGPTSVVVPDGGSRIDIAVETLGRINYGSRLGEQKGIGRVVVRGRLVHTWEHRLFDLQTERITPSGDGRGMLHADVVIDEPADAWLALPGAGTAFVWLGDVLLGRLRANGPQRTLYAPAPMWTAGANRITVIDLDGEPTTVEIRDRPEFGPELEFVV